MYKYIILTILFVVLTLSQPESLNSSTLNNDTLDGSFHIDSVCPDGHMAYDNCVPPTHNGCGPEGSDVSLGQYLPFNHVLIDCCVQHDHCYGSCGGPNYGAHSKYCNDKFYSCMYNQCENHYILHQESLMKDAKQSFCKLNAYLYWRTVTIVARPSYEESQKKHCGCYDPLVQSQPSC